MDAATTQFTDRMGLLFEAEGRPRIAGRIFGYLLLSDDPRSLDQLADSLRVSKASASTNAGAADTSHSLSSRRTRVWVSFILGLGGFHPSAQSTTPLHQTGHVVVL